MHLLKSLTLGLFMLCSYSAAADVYELRTYTAPEGKLPNLLARFENHTLAIFEKHGMKNIGYWTPTKKENTLVYIISHKSETAAKANWKAFVADPQWKKARAESIKNGRIVKKVESQFLSPTSFSALQ